MGLDITSVSNTIGGAVTRTGNALRDKVDAAQGKDLSEEEMLDLQMDVQHWSAMVNLQSNIMKTMADTMKNTVGNMR